MATVKVVLWGDFKKAAGGKGEMAVEVPPGGTVQALMEQLATTCGSQFAAKVITKDKRVMHGVSIFLNGRQVETGATQPSRIVVSDGDLVEVLRLSAT